MMLNMSNKLNNYQRSSNSLNSVGGSMATQSYVTSTSSSSSKRESMKSNATGFIPTGPNTFSNDSNSSLASNSNKTAERESIHSGQFMVSTFEAEEAQDDLDDSEVKMLDPEDPLLSKADETNTCREVQLYMPRKVVKQSYQFGDTGIITSHLEIETSLTKLFKCMNLAYSQKLTSPKWNHFKGVRLRWKDKIRLNNVIWRCWHMQFILKRRTPVCQFASPLDVDIHSNPQSVVLEGKYWKRQLAVIKAEYRKWRRNYKSKVTGCLTYDTRSEFDFLEWSPSTDKSLMLSDDWTTDTLFSSINVPFPFPDSREIARGAGIADFIQPSLGPLQPNLDDIDTTFAELLQYSRLPPVPEESTDEMIKNAVYGFLSAMDTEQIMDVSGGHNQLPTLTNANEDANMMELNTPLNTLQFSEIEQQFNNARNTSASQMVGPGPNMPDDAIMGEPQGQNASVIITQQHQLNNRQQEQLKQHYAANTLVDNNSISQGSNLIMGGRQLNSSSNDFPVKKGRISKSSQRPFRREPHNYDKAQPTLHQTTIYQQMLAEQQKTQQIHQQQQHLQQPTMANSSLQHQASIYQANQQQHQQQALNNAYVQQQQQQQQQAAVHQFPTTNLINSSANYGSSNESITGLGAGGIRGNATSNTFGIMSPPSQNNNQMLNVKIEIPSNDVLSMFNLAQTNDVAYVSGNSGGGGGGSYKPYSHSGNFKKSASTGTYINMRGSTASTNQMQQYLGSQDQSNMHAQSLPLTLGNHLPGLTTGLQMRQPAQISPPNLQQQSSQQQQQQQQQQTSVTTQSMLSLPTTMQTQQQQHQISSAHILNPAAASSQQNMMPKEMQRSNSLPLNVSFQKVDHRLVHQQHDDNNFAVPKYIKCNKTSRTRSNSLHQHMISAPASLSSSSSTGQQSLVGNSVSGCPQLSLNSAGSGSVSGINFNCGGGLTAVNSQLQSATSDPMLNSTLAQLLTTSSSRMSTTAKQHSVSTSAITITTPPPPAPNLAISSALQLGQQQQQHQQQINKVSGGGGGAVLKVSNVYQMTPAQQQLTQQSISSPTSPTITNQQKHQQYQQHHHVQQQQHMQQTKTHVHKSPKKSTSLPVPKAPPMLSSPPASKMLSYPLTASTNLSLSPESFHDQDSPLSPTQTIKYPRDSQRRAGHIHAEQKRRYNIKNGFDQLHDLIPQLQQNNAKLSKAAMLQKGAEHIKHLRNERNILKEHMESLRVERDALNNSLTHLHSILPANGAPVTRQGTEHVRQLYEQYVRRRTQDNWKFWILGLILEPLLSSYTSTVSSASLDELRRTAFLWVDQHCSLIDLRPAVSNKLKYLSMKTDILSDPPSTLHEEVAKAVNNTSGQHPNLHGI